MRAFAHRAGAHNARLGALAPAGLERAAQRAFLRELERCSSPRTAAIGALLFYAGLRTREVTRLLLGDVQMSARKGTATIRASKADRDRVVPLAVEAREALAAYLAVRPKSVDQHLFLSTEGGGICAETVQRAVRTLGVRAGLHVVLGLVSSCWWK